MTRGSDPNRGGRRRRLGALMALTALVVAACGGTATPAPTDPYAIATRAFDASMDLVKLQLGVQATGGTAISIDPGAIEIVLDAKAGKGSLHLSLPVSALGSDAATLQQVGVTGDTLDLDVLFDGTTLFAKSPLAATLLPLLMAQSGQTVPGDLTGWLKLGTADDFAGLAGSLGGLVPTPAPSASTTDLGALDAAQLKSDLEASGVVLTYAGSESRNGVDADHLTATIDFTKLASGPMAKDIPAAQLGQLESLAGTGTLTADVWLDKGSGRLAELDVHIAGSDGSNTDLTLLVSVPSGASFDAPAGATDVPVVPLLTTLLQTFGGSFLPQP